MLEEMLSIDLVQGIKYKWLSSRFEEKLENIER